MTEQRRELIQEVTEKISALVSELETLKNEERDYFDNTSDDFKNSEDGEQANYVKSLLEDAVASIDSAIANAKESIS